MKMKYAIDLPNPHDPEGPMINYGYYPMLRDAFQAAQIHFGAVKGKINIVSKLPDDFEGPPEIQDPLEPVPPENE